jgi:hypothetical protein
LSIPSELAARAFVTKAFLADYVPYQAFTNLALGAPPVINMELDIKTT